MPTETGRKPPPLALQNVRMTREQSPLTKAIIEDIKNCKDVREAREALQATMEKMDFRKLELKMLEENPELIDYFLKGMDK